MMFAGHLLLKKPADWVEVSAQAKGTHTLDIFKNKTFIGIWLMFYLNITCGLALIFPGKGSASFHWFWRNCHDQFLDCDFQCRRKARIFGVRR